MYSSFVSNLKIFVVSNKGFLIMVPMILIIKNNQDRLQVTELHYEGSWQLGLLSQVRLVDGTIYRY